MNRENDHFDLCDMHLFPSIKKIKYKVIHKEIVTSLKISRIFLCHFRIKFRKKHSEIKNFEVASESYNVQF